MKFKVLLVFLFLIRAFCPDAAIIPITTQNVENDLVDFDFFEMVCSLEINSSSLWNSCLGRMNLFTDIGAQVYGHEGALLSCLPSIRAIGTSSCGMITGAVSTISGKLEKFFSYLSRISRQSVGVHVKEV